MEEIIKKLDKKLKILNYEYLDGNLVITVTITNKSDICPCCGKKSNNVHSRYFRITKDLPIQEDKVILFFVKIQNMLKILLLNNLILLRGIQD